MNFNNGETSLAISYDCNVTKKCRVTVNYLPIDMNIKQVIHGQLV